jgi:hypothetical protein
LPRKVARQRGYDVPFVGIGIKPVALGRRETAAVGKALGRSPSREFMAAYCQMLAAYDAHRKAVISSTPAAVQRRIEDVANSARTLQESLRRLTLTDETLFNGAATGRFLRKVRSTGLGELSAKLEHFLPVIEEALGIIKKEPKQGRMSLFADHALAKGLCQILFEETGETPTTQQNGSFGRLLRVAFTQTANPKPGKDVSDLMRLSLREKPSILPPNFRYLSYFRNANERVDPTPSDTGTNKPE